MSLVITPEVAKEMRLPAGFVGMTIAEVIAIGQAKAAAKGSTPAAREIADRIEGSVGPDHDGEGEAGKGAGIVLVIHVPRPVRPVGPKAIESKVVARNLPDVEQVLE